MTRLAFSVFAISLCATSAYADPHAQALSTELEVRERVQYVKNAEFISDNEAGGTLWTQRLAVSASVEFTSWLRARGVAQSALMSGGQRSPVDANVLDAREAYIEVGPETAFVRVGRQELTYGSQRLIGTRDGTNVRRGWDGIVGQLHISDWSIDAIAVALVDVKPEGAFNDRANADRVLAGVYATGPASVGDLDLYLLYAKSDDRQTIEGIADQRRYSAGVRSAGESGRMFWNWEAIYQWGRHGSADISAWTLATNTGLKFNSPWSPEVMLSANVASGDGEADDGLLETFDALYPRGNYFSDAAILGPANFYNLNPYLRLSPSDRWQLSADVNLHWRVDAADGVYGPPGNLLRPPGGSSARFVATAVSFSAVHELSDALQLEAIYAHSEPARFIDETGPSAPVDFVELTLRYTL